MLGQMRALFMTTCVVMPLPGLWSGRNGTTMVALIATPVALDLWLYAGYRRQSFPAWSWWLEGGAVFLQAKKTNNNPPTNQQNNKKNQHRTNDKAQDKIL